MAEATITEYEDLATDSRGHSVMVGSEPNIASQKVVYTTSTQSTALNAKTRFVRISMEGAAGHIAIGTNPTATDADPYIAAGGAEYFGVRKAGTRLIAVYDGTS